MVNKELSDRLSVPNGVINRILYQEILENTPLCSSELQIFDSSNLTKQISKGVNAKIFDLKNKQVGKLSYGSWRKAENTIAEGIREYVKQELAYRRGVSVPKPEGIYKVESDFIDLPLIIMERLFGANLYEVAKMQDKVLERSMHENREKEIAEAKLKGVFPCDNVDKNYFYDEIKNKFYLLDCDVWKFEGIEFEEFGGFPW